MTSIITSIFPGFTARMVPPPVPNQEAARGRMTLLDPQRDSPSTGLADVQGTSFDTESGWEPEWIRRVASGDRTAFERLYSCYHRRLFGYLYSMVGKADVAEELTNDVMFEIWKGASGFRGESRVSTWIFGIARFRALSRLRRTEKELVDLEDAGPLADPHVRSTPFATKAFALASGSPKIASGDGQVARTQFTGWWLWLRSSGCNAARWQS